MRLHEITFPVRRSPTRLARLALAGVSFLAASVVHAAGPWTLASAVAAAQANSPDAALAAQRIAAAKAVVMQAGSAQWPQASLRASYIQTNQPMMAFGAILNQGAFNFGLDFNNPGQVDNFNVAGTVAYPIYTGGRRSAGLAAARAAENAATSDKEATMRDLAAEVTRAYFGIRQAREALVALDDGLKAYEANLKNARARFEAGQLLKAELLNLEVEVSQMREQRLAAEHGTRLADRYFLMLLGEEASASTAVELADADASADALAAPETVSAALRPEIAAMEERVAAAEQAVRLARGGQKPTLAAFASYQLDKGWRLDGDGHSWLAGLQAEWSVFDGRRNSGEIRKAEADLAAAREGLRKMRLGYSLELEQARLAHELALARVQAATSRVAQAQEAAAISRARFAEGALLSAELIGVEARLTESRMRRVFATAEERIAVAALRRAAGLPILSAQDNAS